MSSIDECLGFSKQTAMILEGLGAGSAIPQFKKRNISTAALSQLSKDDLITLGVDETLAESMVQQLKNAVVKDYEPIFDSQIKPSQIIEIIKSNKQQLRLLHNYVIYTRLKLNQDSTDYIIDPNKTARASEALCTATKCTVKEISNLEYELKQFLDAISETETATKLSCSGLYNIFGGIALSVCLICSWRYLANFIKSA